jgi:hypothetical protein
VFEAKEEGMKWLGVWLRGAKDGVNIIGELNTPDVLEQMMEANREIEREASRSFKLNSKYAAEHGSCSRVHSW